LEKMSRTGKLPWSLAFLWSSSSLVLVPDKQIAISSNSASTERLKLKKPPVSDIQKITIYAVYNVGLLS
jgi:hypothetical protein